MTFYDFFVLLQPLLLIFIIKIGNMFFMRRLLLLVLILAIQQGNAQNKRIVFSPQWHAHAQFAGYIVARHLGYYDKEGISVQINYPTETRSSLDLLREGKADMVTTMLPNALMLKANDGVDLVNVMQTSQHSSLCLVRNPGIRETDVKSFNGLRVGLWYNRLSIAAEAMNILQKLNWKIVSFRGGFNLMNYNMIDAIIMMEYNELLHLKYTGKDVSRRSVLYLGEHGYDIPEDGVYCMNDYYKKHTAEVEAFVRATKKGWEWCRENPKQAVDIIISEMRKEGIHSSAVIQSASLNVILKKQELTPGKISYTLDKSCYEQAIKILEEAGLIQARPDYKTFIAR